MHDPSHLPIENLVSAERFKTYLDACAHDVARARRQYIWNLEMARSFWGPLSILEVLVRNALHTHLASRFGDRWYLRGSAVTLREEHERRHVDSALSHLERAGKLNPTPGDVVGATSFGLWVGLVSSGEVMPILDSSGNVVGHDGSVHYVRTLWTPTTHLESAFPHIGDMTMKQLHSKLSTALKLRNRIAHHEPIFNRNHEFALRCILGAIDAVCPETAAYVAKTQSVQATQRSLSRAVIDGECCL